MDGEAVYIRDPRKLSIYDTDMLKKFLLLSHFVFDSKDLAILILDELVKIYVISNRLLKDSWGVSVKYINFELNLYLFKFKYNLSL